MEQGLKIFKFAFWKEWKNFSDVTEKMNVEETFDERELLRWIGKEKSCLVFLGINSKDDLIKASVIMKGLRSLKAVQARLVAVNFSGNKKFDPVFAKLGLQDVLELTVPSKTLKTKIDLWSKSLIKKDQTAEKKVTTKEGMKSEKETALSPEKVRWVDPLMIEDDTWLVKSDLDCVKVIGRWSVKFVGPGPFVASWEDKGNGRWTLKITGGTKELLLPDEGQWIFEGEQRPDFVWAENKWQAVGKQFRLYYQGAAGEVEKFSLKDKILTIAKDSAFAKEKESIFLETFDKKIHVKKTADKIENEEVESETDKYSHLKGKGSTDHIDHPMLEGESSTDDLSSDLLDTEGRTRDPWQQNLEGKGKTERLEQDPLSNEGEWTDDLSSPLLDTEANTRDQWQQNLDGKGKTGKVKADPLSNQKKGDWTDDLSSPLLDTEASKNNSQSPLKNKKPLQGEDPKGPLDGDIENPEDFNQVEKYYRNPTDAGEAETKKNKVKKSSSADESGAEDLFDEIEDAFQEALTDEAASASGKTKRPAEKEKPEKPEEQARKHKNDESDELSDLEKGRREREEKRRERAEKELGERKERLIRETAELRDHGEDRGFDPDPLDDDSSEDGSRSPRRSRHQEEGIDGYLRSPEAKKNQRKKKAGYDFSVELDTDSIPGEKSSESSFERTKKDLTPRERKKAFREAIERATKERARKEKNEITEELDFEEDDTDELEKIVRNGLNEAEEFSEESEEETTLSGSKKKTKSLGEFKLPLLATVSYLKTPRDTYRARLEDYFEGKVILQGAYPSDTAGRMVFKLVFDYCGKELEINLEGEGHFSDGELMMALVPSSKEKMEKVLVLFDELQAKVNEWIKRVEGK